MRVFLYVFVFVLYLFTESSSVFAQGGMASVYLKFRADKIYILDETRVEFVADLYVGTWEAPIQNLYAATFDLTFTSDVILSELTSFVYYPQSFFGAESDVKIIHKNTQQNSKGYLNISISRTDNKGVNGFGKIGEVRFITVSDIIGGRNLDETPFTVVPEYVKLVDVNGNELPHETDSDGATIIIVNDILAREGRALNAPQATIFPNPASDQLYIQLQNLTGERLEIFNVAGQRVLSDQVRSDQVTINTKDLMPGLYTVKIYTEEGTITRRVLLQ